MNSIVYEDYKELRDTFKKKGLSMILLDTIINGITCVITSKDEGEIASTCRAYEYVKDCICGTQIINDFYVAKKLGFDVRKIIENSFPLILEEYDKTK